MHATPLQSNVPILPVHYEQYYGRSPATIIHCYVAPKPKCRSYSYFQANECPLPFGPTVLCHSEGSHISFFCTIDFPIFSPSYFKSCFSLQCHLTKAIGVLLNMSLRLQSACPSWTSHPSHCDFSHERSSGSLSKKMTGL